MLVWCNDFFIQSKISIWRMMTSKNFNFDLKMLRIQLRKMEILYRITNQWVMSWFRLWQECCFIIDGSLCVPLFSLIVSWNNQWQDFHILHRVAWLWIIIKLLFSFLNLHSNVACNFVYESTSICVGVEMRGTGVS